MHCPLTGIGLTLALLLAGCQPENPKAGPAPTVPPPFDPLKAAAEQKPPAQPGEAEASSPSASVAAKESAKSLLDPDQIAEGWIALFDGETLFGWNANSDLNWRVEGGVIAADKGTPGLLLTTSQFADYELKCDFRLEPGGNSGLFLRTPQVPSDPAADCYELNICDTHPKFKSGSLVQRAQPSKEIAADGEWHTFHAILDGPEVKVEFDGEQMLDYHDDSETPLKIGHIGLQMNGGQVEFKNVFLKPLGMKPLFNGEDLSGWREVPGSESKFTVADGAIHVAGGRGFLESEATAKDFVLQFEAITHGDTLNSGVFFRAMPGMEEAPSNGYEFQIQNGYKDNDRTKPEDFGTGAIFRLAPARKVVSNDHEWFTATLVANGPHFATWINGYPVVDWTDKREPNENPREGLRLDAGHFSLQGHDPGTDLNFRNVRIEILPD
jgi:hypothetical protein